MTRLDPVDSANVAHPRTREGLAWLEQHGRDVHMAHLLAGVPHVFNPYLSMSNALLNKASVSSRLRELVILRLGRRFEAEYEWWEHHRLAQAEGVTIDELAAIEHDELDRLDLDDRERFALAVADEWVDADYRITDATWQRGIDLLGRDAWLDLVFILTWWGAWVPAVVRAFEIAVPGVDGS